MSIRGSSIQTLQCLNITPIRLSYTAWPISSAHHLNAGGPPFLHTYALSSNRVSFPFPSTPPFNLVDSLYTPSTEMGPPLRSTSLVPTVL